MKIKSLFFFACFCFFFRDTSCYAQLKNADVVFWNVENFFDPFPDSLLQDPAFTPQGVNHWTWSRFITKRDALAKTIIAMGVEDFPVVVGLCEVESRFALDQLVRRTPLATVGYGFIHRNGPDLRGIDVALLYRHDRFCPLLTRFLTVSLLDTTHHTREILYVKGVLDQLDTLHLFVNHWPSKMGGAKVSTPRRLAAASRLRVSVDSILARHPVANIIIMGDFNDTPLSKTLQGFTSGLLESKHSIPTLLHKKKLYNLSVLLARKKLGTIRYRGRWELIDQFIVSENMLNTQEPIFTSADLCSIFSAPFLLIKDEKFLGWKPYRTYLGPRYQGGISDHLPVVLKIIRNY